MLVEATACLPKLAHFLRHSVENWH